MSTYFHCKAGVPKNVLLSGNVRSHKRYSIGTTLIAVSILLLGCSPQNAASSAVLPLPVSAATSTSTPPASPTPLPPTSTPFSSPTLLPTATITPASSALELVRTIKGNPNPFSLPDTLAFDAQGDMYVLDAGNDRVQVFDPGEKFITMWGSQGSGPGQFNLLVVESDGSSYTVGGIVVDKDNHVYVADGQNSRVQEFDSAGKFLLQWGSHGSNDGQFIRPIALAQDAQGNIYVVDDHRDDIQKFDAQGKFIKKFAGEGSGDGQLSNTGAITIAPDGNLYIADYGNQRIEEFSLDGQYLQQWPTPYPKVDAIAFDRAGNSFSVYDNGALVEYDPSFKQMTLINNFGANALGGVVVGPDGLIYVTDNNSIAVFKEE